MDKSADNEHGEASRGSHQSVNQKPRPASLSSPTVTKVNNAKIGPYILGKTLGVGSTGRVKIGTHIETGVKVAVKIIPKKILKPKEKKGAQSNTPSGDAPETAEQQQQNNDEVVNKKLEREIAIMKIIQHPSVMALYDVYESPDELYMVLELVEGGELFDYLVKQGRLKEMEALDFFQQIIAGMDYCHKHLICHRDLKPENLLLDNERRIKIADFGMASLQVTGKLLETSCGSPHYASPEIIRGVKYDGAQADVWSCGVILYALLTGNLPFDDENIRRLLQRVKSGVYVIPDFVPKDAADLIRKMLVVNPQKRITIEEIEKHPWFLKKTYTWKTGGDGPLRNPPSAEAILAYTGKDEELDEDILNSLSILGYGKEDEIIKMLRSSERNYEKVFYWALQQRKNEFLEKYDNEYDDASRSLHRRTGSRSSVYGERGSIYGSQEILSPAANGRKSEIISDDVGARRRNVSEGKRKSYSPSPLSAAVPDNQIAVAAEREQALKNLTGAPKSPTYESGPSEGTLRQKRGSIFEQFKKQLSLADVSPVTPNGTASSPEKKGEVFAEKNIVEKAPEKADSEKTRRATEAVKLKQLPPSVIIPENKGLQSPVSASSPSIGSAQNWNAQSSPGSPAISAGPKRSWFANLFQFKPEVFVMYSHMPVEKTRVRIEEFLTELGVQFQPSKDGVSLKCKYDANNALPPVKFRISLSYADDDKIEILSTQQQGALSTFQVFFEKFKVCVQ